MNRRQIALGGLAFLGTLALVYYFRTSQSPARAAEKYIENPIMIVISKISSYARNLLKQIESFSPVPYQDAGGYSIGYGTYMGKEPTLRRVTQQEAEALMDRKLDSIHATIKRAVKVPINQNQLDAMALLTYNIGESAFSSSTLVKKLNANDVQGAASQFDVWNKSTGRDGLKKISPTLVARRITEKQLFVS